MFRALVFKTFAAAYRAAAPAVTRMLMVASEAMLRECVRLAEERFPPLAEKTGRQKREWALDEIHRRIDAGCPGGDFPWLDEQQERAGVELVFGPAVDWAVSLGWERPDPATPDLPADSATDPLPDKLTNAL
ncbi:MAG: hypothetical protein KDA41_02320 [Planctomycetales bacterium]|nr:hypothetical protein [Planctomycetales bacterium]